MSHLGSDLLQCVTSGNKREAVKCVLGGLGRGSMRWDALTRHSEGGCTACLHPGTFCSKHSFINLTNRCRSAPSSQDTVVSPYDKCQFLKEFDITDSSATSLYDLRAVRHRGCLDAALASGWEYKVRKDIVCVIYLSCIYTGFPGSSHLSGARLLYLLLCCFGFQWFLSWLLPLFFPRATRQLA